MVQNKIMFDIKDAKPFVCPLCGKTRFEIIHKIMKLSKLAASNRTGHDIFIPVPAYRCMKKGCGYVLENCIIANL